LGWLFPIYGKMFQTTNQISTYIIIYILYIYYVFFSIFHIAMTLSRWPRWPPTHRATYRSRNVPSTRDLEIGGREHLFPYESTVKAQFYQGKTWENSGYMVVLMGLKFCFQNNWWFLWGLKWRLHEIEWRFQALDTSCLCVFLMRI
jgi:hypothetical protein